MLGFCGWCCAHSRGPQKKPNLPLISDMAADRETKTGSMRTAVGNPSEIPV